MLLFPSASRWWNSLCVCVGSFPLLLCASLCSRKHAISPIFYFLLAILHCFLQSFIVSLFLAILNNFTWVKSSDSLHHSDHLITLNSTSPSFSEYSQTHHIFLMFSVLKDLKEDDLNAVNQSTWMLESLSDFCFRLTIHCCLFVCFLTPRWNFSPHLPALHLLWGRCHFWERTGTIPSFSNLWHARQPIGASWFIGSLT